MATFRRRKGKWQVQVRVLGAQPLSRTFIRKEEAQRWALDTEVQIQKGEFQQGLEELKRVTLGDLLVRYRDTITIRKRGHHNEMILINALLRQSFAVTPLASISAEDFSKYRDERVKTVKPTTVNHDLTLLSHLFQLARREWGLQVENPLVHIRKAPSDLPRNRRLETGELEALRDAFAKSRNKEVRPVLEFALETAMRRGEILAVQWKDADLSRRTLHIPVTKTGHARTIPLSPRALEVLEGQGDKNLARPFPLTTGAFKLAWQRVVKRSGLKDLHFHDLRHEAITRFFELGLSIPEVALISGHRDPRMLFRYTHLRAEDVGKKLSVALNQSETSGKL
jgi:integrase